MRFKPHTDQHKLLTELGYLKNQARGYVKPIKQTDIVQGLLGYKNRYHCFVNLDGWIDLHIDLNHHKRNKNRKMKKFSSACVEEMNRLRSLDYSKLSLNQLIWIKLKQLIK